MHESLPALEIPDRVAVQRGPGDLPRLEITTPASRAHIHLLGAHVTSFQNHGDPPLLFTSASSRFQHGHAIRGGVPIIFPWFGPREGRPMHGYARTTDWIPTGTSVQADDSVRVEFTLPPDAGDRDNVSSEVRYAVLVGETLRLELTVTNISHDKPLLFENCLHTYFAVGDIEHVTVHGLQNTDYLDKTDGFSRKTESRVAIPIEGETDRVFLDAPQSLEVCDRDWHRVIRIEKSGSRSTVVWNPWRERSRQMADLGDEEYRGMLCVESGNVADNARRLDPGASAILSVRLSAGPMP